jgi:hypothetical protein
MHERVYYRPRYDRPPHAASFSRVIIGVSGISGEFSGRLITKALESFGAGSSSVEGDLELSVPVCSALTSPFSELEMRTALCLFLKLTKLNAIQDAALMRSSSQVPIQEAELQFLYTEDMSNGPSLGDNDDYGSISRRSSLCISTKSLPLDGSGYPSDGSTPCTTDSPHTSSQCAEQSKYS